MLGGPRTRTRVVVYDTPQPLLESERRGD